MENVVTPIQEIHCQQNNRIFIKRDDLLPFSFGGNKARKAVEFLEDIRANKCDTVVTYGSSSSNHCRIIANMARANGMSCFIISPQEDYVETVNSKLIQMLGAQIIMTPVDQVGETISKTMKELEATCKPYFIQGGGHGNLGTKAYVKAYNEICEYEREHNIKFDYIFLASGTGTTQAGLVCGKILNNSDTKIVGISIARRNPRGKQVVVDSVNEYMASLGFAKDYSDQVEFLDDYILDGYGKYNDEIDQTIQKVLINYGIPLNRTYTGKAFWGMEKYLENIENKNILFIHSGGTPLFFDYLRGERG